MLTLVQGAALIGISRKALQSKISSIKFDKKIKEEFFSINGCFVTLYKDGKIRGSCGMPEPGIPLYQAVVSAAGAAAFRDPRFNPLEKNEANEVCIELTVITNPKKIYVRNPDEYLQRIHLGKDGILVRGVFSSGYLLPVVALEKKMDPLSFLRAACAKAGLKHDEWRDFDTVNVYSFNAQVFGESEPNGNVIQLM
ncbi:AmmeMemoRadiSam system protein A [Candidatus Woesearchaeota archaeon]|nr:AmmeMemoRadiSam system protein A [Candidatus Woesearchaeota archaeon]